MDEVLLAEGPRRYMFSVRATDEANNVASCIEMVDALQTNSAVECTETCLSSEELFSNDLFCCLLFREDTVKGGAPLLYPSNQDRARAHPTSVTLPLPLATLFFSRCSHSAPLSNVC